MTSLPRIVFLDRDTLSPQTRLRAPDFAHELTLHPRTKAAEVAEKIAQADIVITNKVPVRAEAIAGAAKLKLVAVAATGTDNVDLKACGERGITVSNIRGYAVNTVPEHTFALILALRRSIVAYRQSVLDGRWQAAGQFCYFDYPIKDLAGSTLGVIGSGTLGSAVARLGQAFGMNVIFAGRKGASEMPPDRTPFETVLRNSDVLTLHLPLTPATRNLIAAPEFALMARHPLIVNTARGGLIDEMALGDALARGQVAGAGIDVATPEPPPPDHPLMALAKLPNVIVTPHVGWAAQEAIQALADQLIDNIDAFWQGSPRNCVTPA